MIFFKNPTKWSVKMTIRAKRGELSLRDTFIEKLREVLQDENFEIFEEILLKDSLGQRVKISDVIILEKGKFEEIEEGNELILRIQLDAVKTIIETKNPTGTMNQIICFLKRHNPYNTPSPYNFFFDTATTTIEPDKVDILSFLDRLIISITFYKNIFPQPFTYFFLTWAKKNVPFAVTNRRNWATDLIRTFG